MQLLDDDMDELFRNAASRYPLKTDGSDWDAVMRRLPQSDDQLPGSNKRFKWLKWLRWPLLTCLAFLAAVPVLKMGEVPLREGQGTAATHTSVIATTLKSNNEIKTPDNTNSKVTVTNKRHFTIATNNTTNYKIKTEENLNLHVLYASQNEKNIDAAISDLKHHIELQQDTTTAKAPAKTPVQKGLYAGLVLSPDFSTVKGQKVSKPGYGGGLLIGYRISKNVAVETGVLYERKYYYSKGEYFDGKKIGVPTDMNIINVDGWCRMIEIPVNVRYLFGVKPGHNWYVSAGVSSYIMGRENYDYKYERNGYESTRNWDYRNKTRNWFSIINVGVGYQHRLGAIGTLRVEPYLKMPASGVGIGNLPLTSVGLNVGITRSIRF
jgi:hypothetical protein